MWNERRGKTFSFFGGLAMPLFIILPLFANLSWDSERLNLETRMQKRVEDALSKILSPGNFVVVIHVEPVEAPAEASGNRGEQDLFYLPGVPAKKSYDETADRVQDLVESIQTDSRIFRRFIKRITATLVLDQGLPQEDVDKVRDLTRQMLGLDAARGDTLDIQRSQFQKPVPEINESSIFKIQKSLTSYWLLISLALVVFSIVIFFLFIFGPFRGFLNRFVQVLPTLRPAENPAGAQRNNPPDMQVLPALLSQMYGLPMPMQMTPQTMFSGSLHVENPNKATTPFGFIREDHLGNLSVLLSRETPEKAAVVLGYLPSPWISQVLSKLDQAMAAEIATHLATARQLLPEQVEDIEQDLKRRLDYLVGGPDRIFAVYESLDVENQKQMLERLKETRPEVAEELRRRTMNFEDLEKFDSAALKAVLREVDLQTMVASLKGVPASFLDRVLAHVTEGKSQIIREELELSDALPGKATAEAQKKVVAIVKRLEREGQIQSPQAEGSVPSTRYGASLRSTLKLPPSLKLEEAVSVESIPEDDKKSNFKERIRQFLNRRSDRERFPSEEDTLPPSDSEGR